MVARTKVRAMPQVPKVRRTGQCQVRPNRKVLAIAKATAGTGFPVFRVTKDGTLTYANGEGRDLAILLGCRLGKQVPRSVRRFLPGVVRTGRCDEIEVECGGQQVVLTIVPLPKGFPSVQASPPPGGSGPAERSKKARHPPDKGRRG